jgi:hypothetical protein
MTTGISTVRANLMLDTLGDVYLQMHTGDPGKDGTSNISSETTRALADLTAAANGARTLVSAVEWPQPWTAVGQTVTHVSGWTAITAGEFVFSAALSPHVDFVIGLHPTITALSVAIPSLAAD